MPLFERQFFTQMGEKEKEEDASLLAAGRFFFLSFFFPKTNFHFLSDLKYTGRLIAGSLSAFFSTIINNPQVSLRHPLNLECEHLS